MNILGISALYHDAAAALVRDGTVVAAAQEERFTRIKHDPSLPKRAMAWCLRQGEIDLADVDHVVFYEKPLRKFERLLVTHLRHFPWSAGAFSRAMFTWLGDKLWLKNRLIAELGIDPGRLLFTEHHQAHAASAFFPSPFDEAAVLTVDGVGEWATTTLGHGQGDGLEILSELHFPHSLGLLYSAITAFLGFRVNNGEQKVMGLAAYGQPRYVDALQTLIEPLADGGYALDLAAFRYPFDPERSFGPVLEALLGPARSPEGPLHYTGANTRHADIAASVQVVLEHALLRLLDALHRRVPVDAVCLAGGVALNVVANTRLLTEGPFSRLFVQPAAGDAGGALGAALFAHQALGGRRPPRSPCDPYLGEMLRPDPQPGHVELGTEDAVVAELVHRLQSGQTVGWMHGRFEWGPRALGHRSILADPRRASMKDHINAAVKHREAFRPFAPSVASEAAHRLYDIPEGGGSPARFMSLAVGTRDAGVLAAPAAQHVDGTARVQVVGPEASPAYHRLLTAFGEASGEPVLLNTSLNLRGDPICRTERDGLDLMRRSQLDALVVEDRLYTR